MNADFSPARKAWNRFFTAAVWAAAALVIALVAGIIGMVLVVPMAFSRLSSTHCMSSC